MIQFGVNVFQGKHNTVQNVDQGFSRITPLYRLEVRVFQEFTTLYSMARLRCFKNSQHCTVWLGQGVSRIHNTVQCGSVRVFEGLHNSVQIGGQGASRITQSCAEWRLGCFKNYTTLNRMEVRGRQKNKQQSSIKLPFISIIL